MTTHHTGNGHAVVERHRRGETPDHLLIDQDTMRVGRAGTLRLAAPKVEVIKRGRKSAQIGCPHCGEAVWIEGGRQEACPNCGEGRIVYHPGFGTARDYSGR